MEYFVPQCHIVIEQAALRETIEHQQVQQKEMQLAQLYRYATHHHSHHHNNYVLAQRLIQELICHFRDQKMYRFLIELVQKLITKADIIQYTNRNIRNLKPNLASQIASLEYAAITINNFPQLIALRDIIIGYFQTTFQTPPFIINQYLIDLFNEQFIKDIYLTQFNQTHQIQLINYGHPYTTNYSAFTFYLYDDDLYSPAQTQVNTIVVTSQYNYQQPSQNPYSSYPPNQQQLNMTDSQYQKHQSQQNTYQQQQPQQITYNNYSNQSIYGQPSNPYSSVPQPSIQGYSNNSQNQANPYSSPPQPPIVGYQQTSTYNYNNQTTAQTQQYQPVPPQSALNQGYPNYQPQPSGYQNSTQPPGYQNPSQIPSYQNPLQSPGYQNPSQNPGYQNPLQSPGYQDPSQIPGYQNPSQSPGYQDPSQIPGYQNPLQSPGYQDPSQIPGYQNTSQTPGYQNTSQPPGYQNSSQPTHPKQIAQFPPTQGYQYSLQNNQDYQSQQNQVYPNQISPSYPIQNFNNDPKQPVEQQNNYNTNPNQQYNPQNQQAPPYSCGQAQSYESKQLATSQFAQNVAQVPDQPKEQYQVSLDQNNQNTQAQIVRQNSNVQQPIPDLKQATSIYSHPIPNNNQLEYQNPSNQTSGNQQMIPPPPPPPPPAQQQPYQEFLNQKNINEQSPVSQQGSTNFQNSIQNNQPAQDDKSLLEALFINQSLKNLQLLDKQGAPLIDQKLSFRKDRDIKGFKNHDEHALYILKCYVEGKYAQNKIDRTAEMKNLVIF
ncbi:unnamed protein product [Paramecium octaurelia]|uniref:Uncharacterized protein n=1 Tax=Paramecium octaurelia TaxID=43137 RepID=A0A8S1U2P8_PAROT|nr:unnamed protein product [Paramecium octaurelia]